MDIVVEHLTKKYGHQKAVDDISFEVKTGEILGFLGPNGAGKTTTLKMITSYIAPTHGEVKLGGISVTKKNDELAQHIGYLPENNPLYLDMPVIDYLRFIGQLQGIPKSKLMDNVVKMVKLCGLNQEKHKRIGELSKGFRQRVGLAQAMVNEPDILLLDEPTSGLDPNQIIEIRHLIKELGNEKTVMLSTHILSEVEATCDRILIINKGKLVADGTPDTLRKQSQGNEILNLQIEDAGDASTVIQALEALATVSSATQVKNKSGGFQVQSNAGATSKREVFNVCVKNKWILTEMIPLETTLEDVFRGLTVD